VRIARTIDNSLLEYKDLFRLRPTMPVPGNLDPKTVAKGFERENAAYKGLDWEVEDLVSPDFTELFRLDHPAAVREKKAVQGKIHWEFTRDGKAEFFRFVKRHAALDDLAQAVAALKGLRAYLNLK